MENNNNLIVGIIIAVAVFLLLGMFCFGGMMGGSYGMMSDKGYGFGGMWILGLLILIILILFIVWLIKQIQKK